MNGLFKTSLCAVILMGSMVVGASVSVADQATAPGQLMKDDPNFEGNGKANGLNNPNSRRNEHCRGRNCGPDEVVPPEVPVDVVETDDNVEIIDCALPRYADDPLCYVPAPKPAKRKVVSVKMSSEEIVAPPAPVVAEVAPVAPAAAPVAPEVVPVVRAAPSPKLVEVNVFSSSGMTTSDDLSSTNFQ